MVAMIEQIYNRRKINIEAKIKREGKGIKPIDFSGIISDEQIQSAKKWIQAHPSLSIKKLRFVDGFSIAPDKHITSGRGIKSIEEIDAEVYGRLDAKLKEKSNDRIQSK